MSQFDQQYNALVKRIVEEGIWDKDQVVRTKWEDGTPAYTKSVISAQLSFNNTEVPILTTKKVAWKTAIKELLWIWQMKNNNVDDLNAMGVHIWDEWKQPNGTIGKSYGYQMAKKCRILPIKEYDRIRELSDLNHFVTSDRYSVIVDQVDYLLHQLKYNPASRRHITSLWNIEDLDKMALNPCVWNTQWLIKENKLHLIVGIRSNDIALGNPFNVFQYYVLQRMIAQVTGYELGTLTFNINDAHIYERHIELLQDQIEFPQYSAPTLWINPEVKNFYDFTIDDFKLEGYNHGPFISMEVAI